MIVTPVQADPSSFARQNSATAPGNAGSHRCKKVSATLDGLKTSFSTLSQSIPHGDHFLGFGQLAHTAYVLPPGQLILAVSGLYGDKESITAFSRKLAEQGGHEVYPYLDADIQKGKGADPPTERLLCAIDNIRVQKAHQILGTLVKRLEALEDEDTRKKPSLAHRFQQHINLTRWRHRSEKSRWQLLGALCKSTFRETILAQKLLGLPPLKPARLPKAHPLSGVIESRKPKGHSQLLQPNPAQLEELLTFLNLDRSNPLAVPTTRAVFRLVMDDAPKGFLMRIAKLDSMYRPENEHRFHKPWILTLVPVMDQARLNFGRMFRQELRAQNISESALSNAAVSKIIVQVLDRLAPRVTIVGHSLGGFIGTKALFRKQHDIAAIVNMGSPINGTDNVPPATEILATGIPEYIKSEYVRMIRAFIHARMPSIMHVHPESSDVHKIRTLSAASHTSAVSISCLQDGIISPRNTVFNEDRTHYANVLVHSRQAAIPCILHPAIQRSVELLDKLPGGRFAINNSIRASQTWKSISSHCGLIANEHFHYYWDQDGEMLRQTLEPAPIHEVAAAKGPLPRELSSQFRDPLKNIRNLLSEHNYEPMRARVLDLLTDKYEDVPKGQDIEAYRADFIARYRKLSGMLAKMADDKNSLPFRDSTQQKARRLLQILGSDTKTAGRTAKPDSPDAGKLTATKAHRHQALLTFG